MKQILKLTALAIALMLSASTGLAQGTTGNITGTVHDANGAVVAGATVEVTNDRTQEKRTATTSDQGSYTVPFLAVGVYTVTATSTGFAPATTKDVNVSVSFTTETNLNLNPAGSTETVTVASGDTQTQLNTTDQQLSTLIDNRKILDLPLLSRDPNSLILLAPNTTTSDSRLGGFIVNGQRERNNNFQVDGVDNNDTSVPGGRFGAATPNIDATQEFRVITSNFNAEFGRNSGGLINVVTKGGTNDFHGNAYIYYRSDAFSARNFFDVSGSPDPLQRRQYGGSLGGPVLKDKLFFFANYERDRFDQGQQEIRIVPSALARQGILQTGSEFGTINLAAGSSNNAFGLDLNPATLAVLNIYPLGNSPGDSPLPGVFDAFRFATILGQKSHQLTSRVDYKMTEKHSLAGSFNYNTGDFDVLAESFPGRDDGGNAPSKSFNIALNLTSIFKPTLINEFRLGGNRINVMFNLPGTGGAPTGAYGDVLNAFRANGVPQATANFGGVNGSLIDLGNTGITPLNTLGIDSQFRFTGTTTIADAMTYLRGNNTFKFGGEVRYVYENGASNFFRKEFVDFGVSQFDFPIVVDNNGDPLPTTGNGGTINDYASFLYGLVTNQFQSQFYNANGARVDADYRGYRQREVEVFFQDSWKARPNLTLNLGLRYEYKSVPYEVNGQLSNLVAQNPIGATPAGGFVFQTVGKNSANPKQPLYSEDYNNFAPRFGFNYSPGFSSGWLADLTGGPGRTVLRGGYGIFYDRIFGNLFSNSTSNPPFQNQLNEFPFDTLQNVSRAGTLGPITNVLDEAELAVTLFPLPGNNIFQSKFSTPYTQSWNVGIQRDAGHELLLEADYVGSKGTGLLRGIDAAATSVARINAITGSNNAINPANSRNNFLNGTSNTAFGQFGAFLNVSLGHSTYHSMALRATKRLSNTFLGSGSFQAAYTWAHSIDNAPDPIDPGRGGRAVPRDSSGFAGGLAAERGNSDFDTRHRFVANFIYDLPFKSDNGLLNQIISNWSVSGITTLQSGSPFSIFTTRDTAGTGLSARASYAAPGQGRPATEAETERARTQVGPSATLFRVPNTGEIGNVQRNSFYGKGYKNMDLSVIKRFPITESVRVRIQADIFNLFNNVNLLNPSDALQENRITNPNFGQSTVAFPARRMQFALRFEF